MTGSGRTVHDALPPAFLVPVTLDETRRVLESGLSLRPLPLAASFAECRGLHRGQPATIQTHAFSGPNVAYARFVLLEASGLSIGNWLCLSRPSFALPIFGADLVELEAHTMAAVDLTPIGRERAALERELAPLTRRRHAAAPLPSAGALPDFCARFFSPHALFTRVTSAHFVALRDAIADFSDAYVEIAGTRTADGQRDAETLATQERYVQAHREDDKALKLLDKVFGSEWATHFLNEVLFPDPGSF